MSKQPEPIKTEGQKCPKLVALAVQLPRPAPRKPYGFSSPPPRMKGHQSCEERGPGVRKTWTLARLQSGACLGTHRPRGCNFRRAACLACTLAPTIFKFFIISSRSWRPSDGLICKHADLPGHLQGARGRTTPPSLHLQPCLLPTSAGDPWSRVVSFSSMDTQSLRTDETITLTVSRDSPGGRGLLQEALSDVLPYRSEWLPPMSPEAPCPFAHQFRL